MNWLVYKNEIGKLVKLYYMPLLVPFHSILGFITTLGLTEISICLFQIRGASYVMYCLTGTSVQACGDTVGSLDIFTQGIVAQNTTYIVPAYRVPCNSVVVGWKLCYQLKQNVDDTSVTFYPSIWRFHSCSYKLIHSSNVTFVPPVMSGLRFMCNTYPLQTDEQFNVLINDTVGLYSGDDASRIFISNNFSSIIIYSMLGNQSNISHDAATVEHFNITIEAQISMYIAIVFS